MNPTRLKNRWLEKLLDVAITVLSGYGVCAFTLFRGTDKGIAGFIVLFIWAFVATFFWASSLQHFRFVQKLKFYLVLTLSSLLFISHDNHTMEENGLLFFHDLRFVLPHRRPDVTEFVIIAIDTATNTGMEKNANYRKKCIKIFSALDSANISPRLAVLAKEIIEPDDPTRDAAMASQLLARIIGRQAFPVLLRDDYYETNDKEALDFTFCAELNSIYGDDHWNTRWGFLQYNLYGGYSERLIIQNVILRQGARKHLALLAAESLNRLSKSVDTSKVHIIDYPRKKVTVVRVRALLAKKETLKH